MSAPTLTAYLEGVGVLGPGLADWPSLRAIFAGRAPYHRALTVLPSPTLLPAAERRRSVAIVKLTLATGLEAVGAAGLSAATLPSVFSSSGGDGDNCHAICAALASDDRALSPTRFHNSVHNTAAGYWGIATGSMQPASVLSAYDASFAAGLLEALTQTVVDATRCLLLACDTAYPEPLRSVRPIPDAFGIALVLAPQPSDRALVKLELTLGEENADPHVDELADPALESLRRSVPAARGLPLLQAIALGRAQTVVLDYLAGTRLAVAVTPC